jgi:hypothetical protein
MGHFQNFFWTALRLFIGGAFLYAFQDSLVLSSVAPGANASFGDQGPG